MSGAFAGLPARIGRYEIRDVLGRGGLGRVLLGHDPVLNRDVALKLIEEELVEPESLGEVRYMFHREARATASLRHPGIVEVYDYSGPDADLMYMACERITGPTLREVLDERGALEPPIVAALGYELSQALCHAHRQEIVHRDVKPENIFWLDTGRVVLSDFGIAKVFTGSGRLGNTVVHGATSVYGSPAYMAPEQLQGGRVGPATDLHALGAILYECLTGSQAFDGPDVEAILDAVERDVRPSLAGKTDAPQALVDVVQRLLDKKADHRPTGAATARAMRDALDALEVTDPRVLLRGFADHTALVSSATEEETEEQTELFQVPQASSIRVRDQSGFLSSLATRGPFIFAMAGIAVALGVGAYMLVSLGDLPEVGLFGSGAVTSAPQPTLADNQDVFVLLRFPGHHASVAVEGRSMGRRDIGEWDDQVRIALPPGPYTFVVTFPSGAVRRNVLLVSDTEPTFEFSAPSPAPSPGRLEP